MTKKFIITVEDGLVQMRCEGEILLPDFFLAMEAMSRAQSELIRAFFKSKGLHSVHSEAFFIIKEKK